MNQSHHLRLTQDTSVGTIRFMYNIRVLLITICLFVFFFCRLRSVIFIMVQLIYIMMHSFELNIEFIFSFFFVCPDSRRLNTHTGDNNMLTIV